MRALVLFAMLCMDFALAADHGIPVGEKVPDFQLADQTGQNHDLKSVMGPKGVMLVFFRSADW